MSLKGANKMKQLKDFESEELFLKYLVNELECYFYDNEITDDFAVDTFIEYFMAHNFSGDIFKTKNLLYSLSIRYLGYKEEDLPSMS